MPNLITQYDNGTFEAVAGSWNAIFQNVNSAERSTDFAFHGTHSAKLFTKGNQNFLPESIMFMGWPGAAGTEYELTVKIRCDNNFDDGIYFVLYAANGGVPGLSFPVRASDCKGQWAELKINLRGVIADIGNGPEVNVGLMIVDNMKKYSELLPGLFDAFPNLRDFIDTEQTTDYVFANNALVYVDAIFTDVKAIPVQVDPQFAGRKLYYVKNVFLLSDGSNVYQIQEPIKWDQVLIQIKFDESTYRYKFEFSDKDVLLEFDKAAGFDIIREQRRLKGPDANCSLKFGELDEANVLTILFEAQLNFESYIETSYRVKMNCERRSFGELLRSRFDSPTNIFQTTTMDGIALTPLVTKDIFLHPRILKYEAQFRYNENVPVEVDSPTLVATEFKIIPPFKIISSNIQGTDAPVPPDGQIFYSDFVFQPGVSKRVIGFSMQGLQFKFDLTTGVPHPVFTRVSIARVTDITGTPTIAEFEADFQEHALLPTANIVVTSNLSGSFDLGPDEAIFVQIGIGVPTLSSPPVDNIEFLNPGSWTMVLNERTVFAPSKIKGVPIFEALNRQLEIITEKVGVMKSNFFGRTDLGYGSNGCGSNHSLMNGLMVRGFTGRPFPMSTKTSFNSASALWCLGMSIERDNDGNEFVRYEPLQFFFRNLMLMKLGTISDYEKTVADDYTFNELELSFKKFPQNNQPDSLNDWMTQFSFLGPLRTVKNKFSKVIDWLLSGYYFEYTRQEGFKVNPVNSYETDNDTFLLATGEVISEITGVQIEVVDGKIIVHAIVPIVPGDLFTLSGTPVDAEYLATNVDIPFSYDRTVISVNEVLSDSDTPSADISFPEVYQAERDENFQVINGVDNPKSVYNMRHHLKRILYRWAKVWQSGWAFYVRANSPFTYFSKFVSGSNNMNVWTRTNNNCEFKNDIADYGVIDVTEPDKPLFGDSKIKFRAPMTWDGIKYLQKCFEGRSPDNKNYGFLRILNPDGVWEDVYILDLKFDPTKQICRFETIEKYHG